ncbi:hypothetical protein THAOC_31158 [Thalassiosira oceanica]|uniref:Uncharacterized protein n=1 Tax=Thalassiosira oceanica TaxID=159749 RepID=K0RLU4_THAOC|nr:hypothetical protein THAOC_31158 [Thalassiosira oceanica]|eukprot:EJK49916.1 hypothetical protein THAOC_31158 [Thalassiosira oceanica]
MNPIPPSSTTGEDRACRIRNEVINKITGDNALLINCDVEQNVREIRAIIVTNEEVMQRCSSNSRRKVNSPREGLIASPFGPPVETYFRRSYEDIVVKSKYKPTPAAASQGKRGFNAGGSSGPTFSSFTNHGGRGPSVPAVAAVSQPTGGFSFGSQSTSTLGSQQPTSGPPPYQGLFAPAEMATGEKETKRKERKRVEYSVKFELTQDYSEKTFDMSLLSKLPSNLDGILSQDPTPSDGIDYSKLLDRTFLLHEEIQGPYLGALKDHLMNIQVLLGGIETWIIEGSQNADFVEETFGVDLNDLFKDDVARDVTKIVKECESTLSISADISVSSDTDRLQLIKLLELIDIKPKHE